jgi:hypothetical protein
MKSLPPSSKFKVLLATFVSIVPACLLLTLILKYGVDVPHWDEWEYVRFFEKFSQGTLTLGDLFVQQNEYRQFFPNLIFVGLGWLTKWDKRYELLVSFALACLVSFNIYRLEKLTIGGSPARRITIYILANLLIFSPVQFQNWLLGMQIVYFMPIACVTTCLVIAYSQLSARVKFLLCMCLATVSTFSSANGLLCWIVVLPALNRPSARVAGVNRRWLTLVWIAGFLASAMLYFHGFQASSGHPVLADFLGHPLRVFAYFFVLLGKAVEPGGVISLWGYFRLAREIVVGATGLILAGLFMVSTLFVRRDLKLKSPAAVWVMLGTYSIATAILVTIGRAGFGVEQALSSRYSTFTLYLPVALVHLIPIVLDRKFEEGRLVEQKRNLLPVLAGCVAALLSLLYLYNIRQMSAFSQRLVQGKACLLLIKVVDADCLTDKVYPNTEYLKLAANELDRLGFLRPALIKSSRVQDIAIAGGQNAGSYGSLDSVVQTGADVYAASGWAVWRPRGKPADAILLTYDKAEGDSVIFALTDTGEERDVIARIFRRSPPSAYAAWHKSFSLKELPANPVINAWAFDARTGRAVKLDGRQIIQNTTTPKIK